jgi:nuclear pore complex protein Nup98-Nup96
MAKDLSALQLLARSLPRVIQLLPALFADKDDIQQVACLSDMLAVLFELGESLYQAKYVSELGRFIL